MGRFAAPDRARTFADLAFSLLAAGLGLALLFATGQHLFSVPSLDQPDRTLLPITTTGVVPAPMRASPTSARAKESSTVRVSDVRAARPIRTRAVITSLASRGVAGASQRPRTTVDVTKAASQRPRAIAGVSNSAPTHQKSRVKAIPRPPQGAVAARPRKVSGPVARLRSRPHLASAAIGTRRSPGTATAQNGVRVAGTFARGHIVRRLHVAPEPSIIEPPLGYDARPALVLVRGAAQLELGENVIPTIRTRRRY